MRVPFHKNRGKRRREGDLTRRVLEDPDAAADAESGERLTGKGQLTRHRTVVGSEQDEALIRETGDRETETGRVLSAVGANHCRVQTADGLVIECTIRRVVRTLAREARNAVVAGDIVHFSRVDEHSGVIESVDPRKTTLSRGSRQKAHIIVANVDQAVIVASAAMPDLKLPLIDRFLCSTETGGIQGIVCINKCDLVPRERLQPIIGQYALIGYPVVLTNALTGEGIPELRRLLQGHETVFTGQSGVGKTSLLNAVQPGLGRAVGEVSSDTTKGRHTTRVAELMKLDGAGWVVDTPGVRQLQLWDVAREEVEGVFVEFRPYTARCRFPDCRHTHERGCGIKNAVTRGMISPLRYASYVRIVTGDDD